MAKALVMRETGGPEVLRVEEVDVGDPGPGEVRIKQTAIGVNFHDIYVRSGLYQTLPLPGVPGLEAAGEITAVGEGVAGFAVGERVVYVSGNYGAYADERLISADTLVKIPDGVDEISAASMMVRGSTAHVLLHQVFPLQAGQTILVQSAAGGVGQLLVQWAHHMGATVIGTVGSEEKAELVRARGCDHVILYREEDIVERVREITKGEGVAVAYDSVGKDTFYKSLDCLAPLGHLVNFGQSSGPVEPMPVSLLARGSNTVVRPMRGHYTRDPKERDATAAAFFDALKSGVLTPEPPRVYPFEQIGQAHQDMEDRLTSGAVALKV